MIRTAAAAAVTSMGAIQYIVVSSWLHRSLKLVSHIADYARSDSTRPNCWLGVTAPVAPSWIGSGVVGPIEKVLS